MTDYSPAPNPFPSEPSPYWCRLRDYAWVISFLWLIELSDKIIFGNNLELNGIHPRSFSGIPGFFFAPFLHSDWAHLLNNSLSLLVLGAAILLTGWRDLAIVSVVSALSAAVVVWIIGKGGSNHIGASSVVFGYFGFLIASGFYQKTPLTILLAVLVIFFYGGAILAILPTADVRAASISWEGHLGGAIGGFLVARNQRLKLASFSNFAPR
jgi:membrane associated rhomboid family serine protease